MTLIDTDYLATGGGGGAPMGLNTFFLKNGGTPSFVLGVGGFGSVAGAYGESPTPNRQDAKVTHNTRAQAQRSEAWQTRHRYRQATRLSSSQVVHL
jgi:hypothetical protein